MEVGTLPRGTPVENEECVYCFEDCDSELGVNICLQCFTCCCKEHASAHMKERGHTMFLSRKRVTEVSDKEATKLAVGVEGGFDNVKHHDEWELRMFDESGYQPIPEGVIEEQNVLDLVAQLKEAPSLSTADEATQWEQTVVECPHVKGLQQEGEPKAAPIMKCSECDLTSNLWLCLTCGYVGCGRRNWDGSGGNNHAIEHFEKCKHGVVVKMGTISPDGRADMFCYHCDETVCDSNIGKHLKHLGIDVEESVKTEATTTELCVEMNKKWDFDSTTVDGKEFDTKKGPFSVGLKNLGNTCYFNSVLQLVARIPEFFSEYMTPECASAPWTDPRRQFFKLFTAMNEGKLPYVPPRMLRSVVCKGSPIFTGHDQQDAAEFFQYFFQFVKVHNSKTALLKAEFDQIRFCKCNGCDDSSTQQLKDLNVLMLEPPPVEDWEAENHASITQLIEQNLTYGVPRSCEKCQSKEASVLLQFKNFPEYLFVVVRYDVVTPNGTIKKSNLTLDLDPKHLDLSKYRCTVEESVDEKKVAELMNFGFSRAQCVRALQNTDSIEAAVEWIMDNPMEKSPAVMQVMEMGFTEEEAREALEETNGNIGLAIEWLFGPREKKASVSRTDGPGVYELIGFVQHKGPSALAGHYIVNILRDGEWAIYNDRKVAIYPPEQPPDFAHGYIYLFHRKSE